MHAADKRSCNLLEKKKVGKNVTEFERKRHPFMLFHTDTTEKGTTVHRKM
jgi:hypothetical protein